MAHPQVGTAMPAKMSFAKIAAMPAPNVTPALPNIIRENKSRPSANASQHARSGGQVMPVQVIQDVNLPDTKPQMQEITVTMEDLSLAKNREDASLRGTSGESVADDQSQLSNSSVKQQSFDTKSMASVTTFAMDEKESIRPDDSASVRAVEEDDIHPGLSRNSSFQHEIDAQPSLSKSNVRMLGPNVTIAARRFPYTTLVNPPRFGDLPVGPMPEPMMPQPHVDVEPSIVSIDEVRPRPVVANATPDEKLLEALSSPKDRLPLLQLEEKLMTFISAGREAALELPPQNSFMRLLTHKLADYYNLAHHINDENNSVRIFRAGYCAVPIPLAEIAKSVPTGSQKISHATQVKIMRRVQLGARQFSAGNSTAASSSVPSKTTSENGVETNSEEGLQSPIEGTPNKDRSKLTREEREAQYKAARERIFGDFQESVTSESGSTGEASASMSRSSSSSGKKKSRKNKTPKDDTFEARSSFIPSYAPMHMQAAYQPVYNDMQYSSGYNPGTYSPTTYNGSSSNFAGFDPSLSYTNQMGFTPAASTTFSPMDGWQNQQQTPPGNFYGYQNPPPFQQQQLHPGMATQFQHQQTPSSNIPQSPTWASNQFQPAYHPGSPSPSNANWPAFNSATMQNAMPYQYGQLPIQNNTGGVPFANQHPVPGSFTGTKSLFNPQTRSFVPSNGSARNGARVGRKKGQATGSTRTSGASSPAVSSLSENLTARPKEDSLQQKYGTLANLPKKPPPSQVSSPFSNDPTNNSNSGPLIVNGNGKSSAS